MAVGTGVGTSVGVLVGAVVAVGGRGVLVGAGVAVEAGAQPTSTQHTNTQTVAGAFMESISLYSQGFE